MDAPPLVRFSSRQLSLSYWGSFNGSPSCLYRLGFRVQRSGFRVQGLGFRVLSSGSRVQGLGFTFRVEGQGSRV
jgi:hypothetical protein